MLALIAAVLLLFEQVSAHCDALPFPPSQTDVAAFVATEPDYLIIGGGTAGLVMAARLAENTNVTVGVLEAGNFYRDDPWVNVPGLRGNLHANSSYDWHLPTVPQPNLGSRTIFFNRGKMLGGSSGINGMCLHRASAEEYDFWAEINQDYRWTFGNLLPSFQKSTRAAPLDPFPNFSKNLPQPHAAFEGLSGPISESFNSFYSADVAPMVQTLYRLGIPFNPEPNNGNATGLYNMPVSVDSPRGTRSYAAMGYYCERPKRANLHILLGAQVSRILLNKTENGLVAFGALFTVGSRLYQVHTRKEVVLSAGALQSPQILELSGIGNSSILRRAGVKPILDLPSVGENLQDHLQVGVQWTLRPEYQTFDRLANSSFLAQQHILYNNTRSGLLAALDSAVAFVPIQSFVNEDRINELLNVFDNAMAPQTSDLGQVLMPIQRSRFAAGRLPQIEMLFQSRSLRELVPGRDSVSLIAVLMHPLSRGNIHIANNSVLTPPNIDPRFLSHPLDHELLVDALQAALRVGKTEPFSSIVEAQIHPDPNMLSNADLANYTSLYSSEGAHPVGTVAMAPRELGGVVDSSLVVYGTHNLRVVDASIFPIQIAAHSQATVYAVAELAARMMLNGTRTPSNTPRATKLTLHPLGAWMETLQACMKYLRPMSLRMTDRFGG